MEDVEQRSGTPVQPAAAGADRFARLRATRRLICLIFALLVPAAAQAADAYDDVLDRQLAPDPNVTALERALLAEGKLMAQGPEVEPTPSTTYYGLVVAVALLFAGALAFLNWRVNPVKLFRGPAVADLPGLPGEDPGLAAFFNELRDGLAASAHPSVGPVIHSLNGTQTSLATDPVAALLDSAPGRIASFRALFSEISRAPDAVEREKLLVEFADQVRALKNGSRMPALHPVWLMASALEGLLMQISRETSEFTPSSRRTAAGAVDLLEVLCVRGLNPKLATEPPIRILAVDDDAVSRLALTFALKQAFNVPNVAPEGETALALACQHIYDVIFLDVEMPGMDGFELCTKIHETARNRATPVVFVTVHSDFKSRAKSSVSGARDLIGKPFLAFEITVKALTLALRGRLQDGSMESRTASASDRPVLALPPSRAAASGEEGRAHTNVQKCRVSEINPTVPSQPNGHHVPALAKAPADDSPDTFFIHATVYLQQLRNHLQGAQRATNPVELQKLLGELYLGVHAMNLEAEQADVHAVSRLSAALEGMLNKLLEHPKLCTPSTLEAAAAALDLLDDLCWTKSNPNLADSPVRLLVVDDDPVARRAISGSIQLVFGRPDSADSGEEALTMAAEKPYDLIFLDVLMPGIDGYTTCTRIHETALNRHTPVVFVTSHNDIESRPTQAEAAGGCGFIPKPVLASEIKLTALTFILRARLNKFESAATVEAPAELTTA